MAGMPGPEPLDAATGFGPVIGFAVAAFLLVAAVGMWSYRHNQQRLSARTQAAVAAGYSVQDSAPELAHTWPVPPFGTGRRARVENVVSGTYRGAPFTCFEYSYETTDISTNSRGERTESSTRHPYEVAVLRLGMKLADVMVVPDSVFGTFAAVGSGMQAVALDDPAFAATFDVFAVDPKLAYDLLAPATMHHLVNHPDTAFSITRGDIVFVRPGTSAQVWGPGDPTIPPQSSSAPFDIAFTVLAGVPQFVWDDRGGLPDTLRGALR